MPERREEEHDRTISPDATEHLPTMRQLLALPAIVAGSPEVVAGAEALGRRVRWVHVSDSPGVARLLSGGEMLLSTGAAWPAEPDALGTLVEGLVGAGLAALVLELGGAHPHPPEGLVHAARALGLPVVVLHREVKFVTVTEAVHRLIIADQTAAIRAQEEVRERFTALALRGSPADFIVRQLAQTLGAPVVLENLAHEVVAAEVPAALEESVLARWDVRSRIAHRARREGEASVGDESRPWFIVPVEARGTRWGHLVALGGPSHPAGRGSVLEQGAIALALGRLADPDGDEWSRIARRALLDDLLGGRYASLGGATARVEAAGLDGPGARLYGLAVIHAPHTPDAADAAARALGGRALSGSLSDPGRVRAPAGAAILLSLPRRVALDDAAVRRFAGALQAGSERMLVAIGSPANDIEGGLSSLKEARDLSRAALPRGARGIVIRRVEAHPLTRLLAPLRDDHRLLEHGERMLAPLIEHDLARGGDLLDVLGAMLAHPSNRTAAATASHLSRSVFYQRLALIQDLLGVDLDDGEVLAALHIALAMRRAATV